MSKTVGSGLVTALQSDSVQLYFAVEFLFTSGAIRLWTGLGSRTINGQTYTGVGSLLGLDGMAESADLSAKGATVTVSGIDSAMVALAMNEPYQNRKCTIYLGSMDTTDAVVLFSGFMDVMTIQDTGETSSIVIHVESRLARLDRPTVFRYTSESQKARYAGDTFFDWVAKLADKTIYWGKEAVGD